LYEAIYEAKTREAEFLLEHGASAERELKIDGSRGSTPLFYAVADSEKTRAALLIKYGADVNAVFMMNDGGEEYTPLLTAVEEADLELIKMLLDAGANILYANGNGDTALHLAVQCNASEVLELLLERGADPWAKSKEHKSVLDFAKSTKSSKKIIDLLSLYF
jgi:ankyrin repeat protein